MSLDAHQTGAQICCFPVERASEHMKTGKYCIHKSVSIILYNNCCMITLYHIGSHILLQLKCLVQKKLASVFGLNKQSSAHTFYYNLNQIKQSKLAACHVRKPCSLFLKQIFNS